LYSDIKGLSSDVQVVLALILSLLPLTLCEKRPAAFGYYSTNNWCNRLTVVMELRIIEVLKKVWCICDVTKN